MKVIDKINGSGLFAQSAFSAATATKDNLGRDITATYLTGVNLPESATWNDTSNVVSSNSAQWSQGKTYEGISPIVVNNNENKISANTWTLTAGNGIALVEDSANNITRIDCTASGDAGVNSFVTNNSASILDVNSSYKQNSGTFTTVDWVLGQGYATVGWVLEQGYLTEHQDISNKLDSSAFSSVSGDFLTTAFSLPESATWSDTSNVVSSHSAQWAEGGGGSVSSKYGTITVDGSDIEATNSAIEFKSEGFRSSFNDTIADEWNPRTFTWDDYSEGTTFMSRISNYGDDSDVLTYSSNTNVTGNITIPNHQTSSVILQLPNATAVQFTTTGRGIYRLSNIEVTATSSNQVKELAWKNDLPTYSYNSNNKLSAINGSALVGNEDYLVQQGFVQNLSSPYSTIAVKDNKVEATNSAIKSDTYIEGFVSAYNDIRVYPGNSATLTWTNYVPNTKLYVSGGENWQEYTLTYSANTDVTGTITVSTAGQANIEVPTDSTSIVIGNSGYDYYNFTVSAEDYYEVGELAWKSDVPSFEYNDSLISAIGTSGLYSTSAGTANKASGVLDNGTFGKNIDWSANGHRMVLNPTRTPFSVTSGIFNYLAYATGACIAYGSSRGTEQYFGGYFKGNEWFISNASQNWAMMGGYNGEVHLSGVTTRGYDFNLSQRGVRGKSSNGTWEYGVAEDTLLRSVSSNSAIQASALPISAGNGINATVVDGVVRIGSDETVLWSGDKTGTGTILLSEGVNNFESIAVYISSEGVGITAPQKFESLVNFDYGKFVIRYGGELSKSLVAAENSIYIWGGELVVSDTSYTTLNVGRTNRAHISSITTVINHSDLTHICKIVGINRINANNA